jgi:hypothetical protein
MNDDRSSNEPSNLGQSNLDPSKLEHSQLGESNAERATFDSTLPARIPDAEGPAASDDNAHASGSNLPLSSDVDPIHDFEDADDHDESAPLGHGTSDSPNTHADAGLLSESDLPESALDFDARVNGAASNLPLDEEGLSLESGDLDENLGEGVVQEIPLGNLDVETMDDPVTRSTLRSPDMDAPDMPGQIDIEALGDGDIEHLLPPDARLDPIEE